MKKDKNNLRESENVEDRQRRYNIHITEFLKKKTKN